MAGHSIGGGLVDIFVSMYLGEHFPAKGGVGFVIFSTPLSSNPEKSWKIRVKATLKLFFLFMMWRLEIVPQNSLKSMLNVNRTSKVLGVVTRSSITLKQKH